MLRNVLRNTKQAAVIIRLMSRTAQDSYVPQSPRLWEASTSTANESDLALLRRGDFVGVSSSRDGIKAPQNPEISLARLQNSYRSNYRVPADNVLAIVLQLEADDNRTVTTIKKSADKWLPLLIQTCGLSMSNLEASSRQIIFDRLWKQIDRHGMNISIGTYNARLNVLLENEIEFDPEEELMVIERDGGLQPNIGTFHGLLEQTALRGNVEKFKSLVYKMGTQGCVLDSQCHAFLVYCMAVRGFHQKADSLVEQAGIKFDKEAYYLALGACAKAAAARGDIDRLRKVLRRSVDAYKKIAFPPEAMFDVIWQLSNKNKNDYSRGANIELIEQILERISRPRGFFRLLFREMERHVTAGNYYTAITLLDDMKRIMDCLENQQKSLFLTQFLSRMCRQLIQNRIPMEIVRDIANRISAIFEGTQLKIYDELLYSSLMYRKFNMDEKFNYVSTLIDTVDSRRERPHIILPLIASVDSIEERLPIIYRCGNLGYKNISQLDIRCLAQLVLWPLHESIKTPKSGTRLDKAAKVLKSFGVSERVIWYVYHNWFKLMEEEHTIRNDGNDSFLRFPLKEWLRTNHPAVFESTAASLAPPVKPTYERLKSIVESRDSSKATTYVLTYGWPEDTKYDEIISEFIDIVLAHEDWAVVKKFLTSLSNRIADDKTSPVKNFHILRILTRAAQEGDQVSITNLIDLCYELKRLFPRAIHEYENFFDAIRSYSNLFYRIFERLNNPDVKEVDQAIDLLKALVKLEFVSLHPSETLTTMFIGNVLRKIGWNEAVGAWMKFQSGLHCSNGIVSLIRFCISYSGEQHKDHIQYLLHKAQNFISASRVHLLYVAILVSIRKKEEAIIYLENNKNSIDVQDCPSVIKLMNALKTKSFDEDFNLKFLDVCLKHTNLKDQPDTISDIKDYCLRTCEAKNLAPLGLRIFKKLRSYDIVFNDNEKLKLWKLVENHSQLAQRWIFGDQGLLRIDKDDNIIKNFDIYSISQELHQEIKELQAGTARAQ